MLDLKGLNAFIDADYNHGGATLFRLETHDHLDVRSDDGNMARYFAGEPRPHRPWTDVIRSEVERGMITYRVHIVRAPLSPYLRYAMDWGYTDNERAGERIRIIDLAEQKLPAELADFWETKNDFWLVDDRKVARMIYDNAGRFVGAEPLDNGENVAVYRRCAAVAWETGTPFGQYWTARPELHRDRVPTQERTTVECDSGQPAADRATPTS